MCKCILLATAILTSFVALWGLLEYSGLGYHSKYKVWQEKERIRNAPPIQSGMGESPLTQILSTLDESSRVYAPYPAFPNLVCYFNKGKPTGATFDLFQNGKMELPEDGSINLKSVIASDGTINIGECIILGEFDFRLRSKFPHPKHEHAPAWVLKEDFSFEELSICRQEHNITKDQVATCEENTKDYLRQCSQELENTKEDLRQCEEGVVEKMIGSALEKSVEKIQEGLDYINSTLLRPYHRRRQEEEEEGRPRSSSLPTDDGAFVDDGDNFIEKMMKDGAVCMYEPTLPFHLGVPIFCVNTTMSVFPAFICHHLVLTDEESGLQVWFVDKTALMLLDLDPKPFVNNDSSSVDTSNKPGICREMVWKSLWKHVLGNDSDYGTNCDSYDE